eukprot:3072157-Pyramimonas_sp.AAC.1
MPARRPAGSTSFPAPASEKGHEARACAHNASDSTEHGHTMHGERHRAHANTRGAPEPPGSATLCETERGPP